MERQDLMADDLTNERLPSPAHRDDVAHDFKLDPDTRGQPPGDPYASAKGAATGTGAGTAD